MGKRFLVFGAHPDDPDLMFGGSAVLLSQTSDSDHQDEHQIPESVFPLLSLHKCSCQKTAVICQQEIISGNHYCPVKITGVN